MAEPNAIEFRAMGSRCRIVTVGGGRHLPQRARALVHRLERRWSRFLPSSEVSALNRRAGAITVVSDQTYQLVGRAVAASERTGGRFNPLMLDQLEHHGYREPWNDDDRPEPTGHATPPATTESIDLYPEASAVRLPPGARFDPGGIGKGFAVDIAVESCVADGATTASVELGGDLRVYGRPWYGPDWRIGVANPFDRASDIATFTPTGGAVTTSTTLRRAWRANGRALHHLLDPATGRPSRSDVVAVTTCSRLAWWAEVAAKAALLAGSRLVTTVLDDLDTPGIAVTADGVVLRTGDATSSALASSP